MSYDENIRQSALNRLLTHIFLPKYLPSYTAKAELCEDECDMLKLFRNVIKNIASQITEDFPVRVRTLFENWCT